jgi:hypothetical protein
MNRQAIDRKIVGILERSTKNIVRTSSLVFNSLKFRFQNYGHFIGFDSCFDS